MDCVSHENCRTATNCVFCDPFRVYGRGLAPVLAYRIWRGVGGGNQHTFQPERRANQDASGMAAKIADRLGTMFLHPARCFDQSFPASRGRFAKFGISLALPVRSEASNNDGVTPERQLPQWSAMRASSVL